METQTKIPVLKKIKIIAQKEWNPSVSACCSPKNKESVCCTPSEKPDDNGGACCGQPGDGSPCCDK